MYDWLLFLHVASAFAMVAAYVVFTIVVVAGWRAERPSSALALCDVARPANILVVAGAVGTLVFGVWLAIYIDGYELWDGWILGALVLWAISAETGRRTGIVYSQAQASAQRLASEGRDEAATELREQLRSRAGLVFHAATGVAILLVLILMIYKPGGA